jgi:hypothetical protein
MVGAINTNGIVSSVDASNNYPSPDVVQNEEDHLRREFLSRVWDIDRVIQRDITSRTTDPLNQLTNEDRRLREKMAGFALPKLHLKENIKNALVHEIPYPTTLLEISASIIANSRGS